MQTSRRHDAEHAPRKEGSPSSAPQPPARRVSMVTTVLNAHEGLHALLDSLIEQTRMPDEVIVVDGGSTDGTLAVVHHAMRRDKRIRLIEHPGANIAQGRNVGIAAATGEIILSSDTGCRLDPQWAAHLIRPFGQHPDMELVAGFYKIDPQNLTEAVVGTATMRGALDPVNPDTFNPSCRSVAFTKALWERAGGFPEFVGVDDTLFNIKLRQMDVKRCFVPEAVVHWQPRSTLASIYRQFRHYASWRGHTQLDAQGIRYHLRNLIACLVLLVVAVCFPPAWLPLLAAAAYFYVVGFHAKSVRVAAKLGTWRAYPLSLIVHWTIMLAGISGYLRASLQRWRHRDRYRRCTEAYLAGA